MMRNIAILNLRQRGRLEMSDDIPTDKLNEHLTSAKNTLAMLPDHVEREPALQSALEQLMKAGPNILARFLQMAEEQPEVATRILLSSTSAMVNLHVVDNVSAELKRRAEGN